MVCSFDSGCSLAVRAGWFPAASPRSTTSSTSPSSHDTGDATDTSPTYKDTWYTPACVGQGTHSHVITPSGPPASKCFMLLTILTESLTMSVRTVALGAGLEGERCLATQKRKRANVRMCRGAEAIAYLLAYLCCNGGGWGCNDIACVLL